MPRSVGIFVAQQNRETLCVKKIVMGYFVARLDRPYDFRVLIEVYIYTRRKDFVHQDFTLYYRSLLESLQQLFGIDMPGEQFSFDQRVLWGLFNGTVDSLLQITSPWAGFLEASLLHRKLNECGEPGEIVYQASKTIGAANRSSAQAHREMLYALFTAVFGACDRVVTSDELRGVGFDDAQEPDIKNYYDYV